MALSLWLVPFSLVSHHEEYRVSRLEQYLAALIKPRERESSRLLSGASPASRPGLARTPARPGPARRGPRASRGRAASPDISRAGDSLWSLASIPALFAPSLPLYTTPRLPIRCAVSSTLRHAPLTDQLALGLPRRHS